MLDYETFYYDQKYRVPCCINGRSQIKGIAEKRSNQWTAKQIVESLPTDTGFKCSVR